MKYHRLDTMQQTDRKQTGEETRKDNKKGNVKIQRILSNAIHI
jgi:hypothetical protein